MSVSDPQLRIAQLESELKWAHLKIQVIEERPRQQRIRMLGPHSETLTNLQLELLADEEPSATSDEVAAEARREPIPRNPPREGNPHPAGDAREPPPQRPPGGGNPPPAREGRPEGPPGVKKVIRGEEQPCRTCGQE